VRKLVFITQRADPEHPALAATVPKIAALAERADEVVVLTAGAVRGALPSNCRIRSFRAPSQAARGLRFASALAVELVRGRPILVVAHMCPIYAILAAPLVRPLRIPLVLWFTHWRATDKLRLATRLSSAVVSVDLRSFPFSATKLTPIGHGIDLERFGCTTPRPSEERPLELIALVRYNPAKGYDVVLAAVRLAIDADTDLRLTIHGPVLTDEDEEHRRRLEQLRAELGLEQHVELAGPVSHTDVPRLLAGADALVNNTRGGSADKIVFEAGASCLPALASAPAFDGLVPTDLRFRPDDPAELAASLARFAKLDVKARGAIGRRLRDRVAAEHSVANWATGILAAASGR